METAFTKLVGVEHPIVQTGMGWVAGPRLVSAAANAGALGILASATMTTEQLRSAVREVRSRVPEGTPSASTCARTPGTRPSASG